MALILIDVNFAGLQREFLIIVVYSIIEAARSAGNVHCPVGSKRAVAMNKDFFLMEFDRQRVWWSI